MTKPTRKVLAALALLPVVGLAVAVIATMQEPARSIVLGVLGLLALMAGSVGVVCLAVWGIQELFGRSR